MTHKIHARVRKLSSMKAGCLLPPLESGVLSSQHSTHGRFATCEMVRTRGRRKRSVVRCRALLGRKWGFVAFASNERFFSLLTPEKLMRLPAPSSVFIRYRSGREVYAPAEATGISALRHARATFSGTPLLPLGRGVPAPGCRWLRDTSLARKS